MKTTFTRTFVTVTVILLVGLLSIGVFLRALLRGYLDETTYTQLENDAKVISQLAVSYHQEDGQIWNRDFFVNLNTVSEVSEADTVICNVHGKILLCSEDYLNCPHNGMVLSRDYLNRVAANGRSRDIGLIQGLYEDNRYVCATTIQSQGNLAGFVIVSIPVAASQSVLNKMTDFYILLAVSAVLLSVLVVSIFVHRQSRPLQVMAKTARSFGQGELSARVPIRDGYTSEVDQLATAFNNMAASLEKSEHQRQEFVANVSHELKTPMTTIGGYVDGILDGTIPPDKAGQYMQVVSDETKRLSRLVRSMLDISRLQDAPIPQSVDRRRWDTERIAQRQKGCIGAPYNMFRLYGYDIDVDLRDPGPDEKEPIVHPLHDGQQFDLGGRIVTAYECPGHAPGEMVFLDSQTRCLFAGDALNYNLGVASVPVETTLRYLKRLQAMSDQYDCIYNGHHDFRALGAPLDEDCLPNAIALCEDIVAGHYSPAEVPSFWGQPMPLGKAKRPDKAPPMIAGQVMDLWCEKNAVAEASALSYIQRDKTACMFIYPLRAAAWLSGADEAQIDALGCYGEQFGRVFQATDDLLDVVGDSAEMGKTLGKDAEQGKLTMVSLYGVDGARKMVNEQLEKALAALENFGKDADFFRELIRSMVNRTN